VLRSVIIALAVLFLVLAFFRLNVREIDRTGLCGSVVQGSTHDDSGSSTRDCNRLRHRDGVAAVALVIIGVAALGVGVGDAIYTRER
jgi:hypothetical protein